MGPEQYLVLFFYAIRFFPRKKHILVQNDCPLYFFIRLPCSLICPFYIISLPSYIYPRLNFPCEMQPCYQDIYNKQKAMRRENW